jgi:hypothetical protein
MADYIVNISVLKNHGGAGVTLSLKNHYGTCNAPSYLHGNNCDPYIPALNALAPIRGKQTICICDALLGIYSGGPGGNPQFTANKLIFSRDPVALDYCGRELLGENGCSTLGKAHHIDTAAGAPYNLGTNDPEQIIVETVTEPSGIDSEGPPAGVGRPVLEQNRPNPFRGHTDIRFHTTRREMVTLTVYDTTGRSVRELVKTVLGPGWHEVRWDGRNASGQQTTSGIYFCELRSNGFRESLPMQLVR